MATLPTRVDARQTALLDGVHAHLAPDPALLKGPSDTAQTGGTAALDMAYVAHDLVLEEVYKDEEEDHDADDDGEDEPVLGQFVHLRLDGVVHDLMPAGRGGCVRHSGTGRRTFGRRIGLDERWGRVGIRWDELKYRREEPLPRIEETKLVPGLRQDARFSLLVDDGKCFGLPLPQAASQQDND